MPAIKVNVKTAQEINKLYDEGWTYKEVAAEMRLSLTTIQRYVWKPRNKGCRSYK